MKKVLLIITWVVLLTAGTAVGTLAETRLSPKAAGPAQEAGCETQTPLSLDSGQLPAFPHLTPETKFIPKNTNQHSVSDVSEGIFSLQEYNREYGYSSYFSFYSIEGEYLFPPMWEMSNGGGAPIFDSGAAVVKYPRKLNPNAPHAIIYSDGSVRELPTTWKEVTQFHDGVAMVYEVNPHQGQQIFYINIMGEKILPHLTHVYSGKGPMGVKDRMRDLKENRRAFFNYDNQKWGFLDDEGNIAITPNFGEVRDFHGGYALAIVKEQNASGKPVFIDPSGKIVCNIPDNASTLYYAEKISDVDNGIFCIRDYGKAVYYDLTGKELAQYPEGTPFHNGYAFIKTSSAYKTPISIINTKFSIVKEIGFDNLSLNSEKARFNGLDISTFDKKYVFTNKGELILRAGDNYNDAILDFSEDGYAKSLSTLIRPRIRPRRRIRPRLLSTASRKDPRLSPKPPTTFR